MTGQEDLLGHRLPVPAHPEDRPPSPVSAEKHRARMRARMLANGPDGIADHELLEMVLFLALARRDTKPIAHALLTRFGSFANAVSATPADLRRVEGLGEAGAAALKTIEAAALRLIRAQVPNAAEPGAGAGWQGTARYRRDE